jgi:DNA repair protein RadC
MIKSVNKKFNSKSEILNVKIQDLALDDRPREKLMQKGCAALSTAELLGIIIGSGNSTMSAVNLAQAILSHYDNDLNALAKCSVKDFQKFKGIGEAKAIAIISAIELTRRREYPAKNCIPILCSSSSIYNFMKAELADKITEELWILLLNNSNRLLRKQLVSTGGITTTIIDSRVIFKFALEYNATGIVLIHNHPSGNPHPSTSDIDLTKKIIEGGKVLSIPVLDHIIVAGSTYFSFVDERLLF